MGKPWHFQKKWKAYQWFRGLKFSFKTGNFYAVFHGEVCPFFEEVKDLPMISGIKIFVWDGKIFRSFFMGKSFLFRKIEGFTNDFVVKNFRMRRKYFDVVNHGKALTFSEKVKDLPMISGFKILVWDGKIFMAYFMGKPWHFQKKWRTCQ